MEQRKVKGYFFGAVLTASVAMTLLVFRSYLVPLVLGGVLAIVAMPIYRRLCRLLRSEVAAALLTVILSLIVIILPAAYLISSLAAEIGKTVQDAQAYLGYSEMEAFLERILPEAMAENIPAIMGQTMSVLSAAVQGLSTGIFRFFSNLMSASLSFMVAMFSMYYLLKDGGNIKRILLRLSPLDDDRDQRIFDGVTKTVRAVLLGFLLIGVIKGILAGLSYWIIGISVPLFWGLLTGLSSFLPVVGTGLIMVPIAAYLAITGQWGAAIGLLVYMTVVVGMVDNFIQPKFVGSRTKIHPLFVLLALLGGLEFFGFVGLILGPLILAITLALVGIYESDYGANRTDVPAPEKPEGTAGQAGISGLPVE